MTGDGPLRALRCLLRPGTPSRARRDSDDRGATLIEMVVTLSVMSVMMSIFTTGVLQMFRVANRTEATARTQSQVTQAFMRLDTGIRYASTVGTASPIGDAWYIEYLTTNVDNAVCTRLRLSAGLLQQQVWPEKESPGDNWATLVTDLHVAKSSEVTLPTLETTPAATAAPFTVLPAQTPFSYQRLRVVLRSGGPAAEDPASATLDVIFAALNSTGTAPPTPVCQEGRPTS